MPHDHVTRWERELQTQALDGELYLAGKRAGAAIAGAEWPDVSRRREALLGKGIRATKDLFGQRGITLNAAYLAGWVAGYEVRREALDHAMRG